MIRSFVVLLNSFVFIPCTLQQQKLDGPIEIPDLGRHFRLGNLYNIRTDQIVPGRSLWTEERLRMHETRPIPFTEFQIAASDDFNSKASLFDLEVGIRASFLSGQIKVEGAAKYLDDRASSNYVTRMSLKYTAMTHMKELVMEHLGPGNFDFPYVFDNEEVTHVVTRVEYGAQAVLIFESDSHNSSHKREIRGRLKIGVAVMPALSIAGEGSLNLTDEEKNEFSRFRCTFYGDVNPPIAPTNYLDAIHMYKLLPKQINQQTSVPVKVYLFPLSKLDSKGARLLRQISANLLKRVETTFEEYHEVEKVLGDIINYSPTFRELPTMKTHVELFKNSLETQKLQFQRRVARILPEIRGQGKAERDLAQILIDHESSPYSLERATNWIDWKIREAKSLEPLLSWKPPLVATQPGELEGVLFHRVNKDTMVLMLQLYPSTDHFSNCMLRQEQPECAGGSDYHSWLILPALGRGVRRKMYFLQELYERNNISVTKSRPRPSFAIGHFSSRDAMDKNVTFRWYKGSEIAHGDFRPPEMRDLTVTVRGRFAVLNWRIEGSESLIEGYKILFRRKPDGEWNVALSDDKNPSYNLQMPAESQKIALLEKGNGKEL